MENTQIGYPKGEMSLRELTDASLTNYRLQRNSDNRSPSISIPSDERTSGATVGSCGPRMSTSIDLAMERRLTRKPKLRRRVDIEVGGVGGVKEAGSGTRRSSGRRVTVAMVEQLVPLLDISHAAARGGARGGGRQRPWWSRASPARSPVGLQLRRRRAARRPPRSRGGSCEREEAQGEWVSTECAIFVRLEEEHGR
jgi:hypothetical protein